MELPKWVLIQNKKTKDYWLETGIVEFHSEIFNSSVWDCLGGGLYFNDKQNNDFILYSKSHDLGKLKI
jgi:hypothetical protein